MTNATLEKHKTATRWALIGAIIWIIIGPYLLSIKAGPLTDYSNSGEIGDLIAGATAPFIGLLSAYLVYLSFSAQIQANQITNNENNHKNLLDQFENITIKFTDFKRSNGNGISSISILIDNVEGDIKNKEFSNSGNDVYLHNLNFLIINYSIFLFEIKTTALEEERSEMIKARVWFHYEENLTKKIDKVLEWKIPVIDKSNNAYHGTITEFQSNCAIVKKLAEEFIPAASNISGLLMNQK